MIKNFIPKKGDQISFLVTFIGEVNINSMEFGVKRDYTDEDFIILKSLNNGITQIDSNHYQVVVPSNETNKLDFDVYVYDLRTRNGNIIKTPLSGKIIVKESVFNG